MGVMYTYCCQHCTCSAVNTNSRRGLIVAKLELCMCTVLLASHFRWGAGCHRQWAPDIPRQPCIHPQSISHHPPSPCLWQHSLESRQALSLPQHVRYQSQKVRQAAWRASGELHSPHATDCSYTLHCCRCHLEHALESSWAHLRSPLNCTLDKL